MAHVRAWPRCALLERGFFSTKSPLGVMLEFFRLGFRVLSAALSKLFQCIQENPAGLGFRAMHLLMSNQCRVNQWVSKFVRSFPKEDAASP